MGERVGLVVKKRGVGAVYIYECGGHVDPPTCHVPRLLEI